MSLHQSGLGNATNAVAFVGLLLDVMGTFLGVVHAMMLQRRIKENTAVLNAMTNLKAILKTHSMSRDRLIEEQLQDIGPEILEEQFRLFEFLQRRFRSPSPFGLALGLSDITIQNVQTVKSLFGFGYTPLVAMGLGVVALVVSTIMFAAASTAFSSVVWVSCVAVLCGVIGLSLLPITFVSFFVVISNIHLFFQLRESEEYGLSKFYVSCRERRSSKYAEMRTE